MKIRSVRSLLALALVAFCTAAAGAAPVPSGDPKLGVKLGIMEMNNSGQDGETTLFWRDNGETTIVVLRVEGEPALRIEPASIHRTQGFCETVNPQTVYRLNPVIHGHSTTTLHVPIMKLLSGNYSIVVGARLIDPNHYISCSHLYQ